MSLRRWARMRRQAASTGTALLLLALSASSCTDLSELQFRQDHRLTFTAPEQRALVTDPVTVRWTIEGFTVLTADARGPRDEEHGLLAVFVDRAPIKAGHHIAEVVDEQACGTATCVDRARLAEQGVQVTRRNRITLRDIPRLTERANTQMHQMTVILLDVDGRRIGEAAWYLEFRIEHKAVS